MATERSESVEFSFTKAIDSATSGGDNKSTVSIGPYTASQGSPAFFYEKAIVGYSVTAKSGTWGIRVLTYNPAAPGIAANAMIGNNGNTGVGLSSGFLTLTASRCGLDNNVVSGGVTGQNILGHMFPNAIEFDRTGGASGSITCVISGKYFNP